MPDSAHRSLNLRPDDAPAERPPGRNHLLVIGIDSYPHCGKLANAVRDAEAFAALLMDRYDFVQERTYPLMNDKADKQGITRAFRKLIEDFKDEQKAKGDNLIVYFSGHGHYDEALREGYWVPYDARYDAEVDYISYSYLQKAIAAIEAHHILLIVDSCYSGAVLVHGKETPAAVRLETNPSRWMLASGRNEVVPDGIAGRNSPFAEHMLDVLARRADKPLPLQSLVAEVTDNVTYNSTQTPIGEPIRDVGHKGGQFIFRPLPSAERRWQQALAENKASAWLDYVRHWVHEREPDNDRLTEALDRAEELAERSQAEPAELAALRKQLTALRQEITDLKREKRAAQQAQEQAEAQAKLLQSELEEAQANAEAKESVISDAQAKIAGAEKALADLRIALNTQTQAREQLRAELAQARQAGSAAYENAARQIWEEQFSKTSRIEELDRFLRWFPEGGPAAQARALREKLRSLSLPEMIRIEGGSFVMGSNDYDNEKPPHRVRLSSFEIGKYPVTQRQWETVMGQNPSHFDGPELPVENVFWNDVQAFIGKLNEKTGLNYRLPTEAEWEYAAGGGAENRTKWAGTSNENQLGDYAWYEANSDGQTHPVGQKKPNGLGLYDMSGNVWEWCSDWYGNYSSEPQTNPTGPATGTGRVVRGGGWLGGPVRCRVADRIGFDPAFRLIVIGFRLARQF